MNLPEGWELLNVKELISKDIQENLMTAYNAMVAGGLNAQEIHQKILTIIEYEHEKIEKCGVEMKSFAYALQIMLQDMKKREANYPDWINN